MPLNITAGRYWVPTVGDGCNHASLLLTQQQIDMVLNVHEWHPLIESVAIATVDVYELNASLLKNIKQSSDLTSISLG